MNTIVDDNINFSLEYSIGDHGGATRLRFQNIGKNVIKQGRTEGNDQEYRNNYTQLIHLFYSYIYTFLYINWI